MENKNLLLKSLASVLFLLFIIPVYSQTRKLARSVSSSLYNDVYPSVSADEGMLVYIDDNGPGRSLQLVSSTDLPGNDWTRPEPVGIYNKSIKLNLDHGFFLSYDGRTMYFTSKKYGGVFSYDIWTMQRSGKNWQIPSNPGKPLNSDLADGAPSVTPDGKYMYFMRCQTIDNEDDCCKIMVSKNLKGDYWDDAKALPSNINTGCESHPKILPDGQTLVFSSSRTGGKGGKDLYLTRMEGNGWTDPVPMDFLNTEEDDIHVSIPARGDLAYFSAKKGDNYDLYQAKIPEELRMKDVKLITGTLMDGAGKKVPGQLQAIDTKTGELIQKVDTYSDGTFFMILPEGTNYDFSLRPKDTGMMHYSTILDMKDMERPDKLNLDITSKPFKKGSTYYLNTVHVLADGKTLTPESDYELDRLVFLLKNNPQFKLEAGAHIGAYEQDSVKREGLTEVIIDTLKKVVVDTMKVPVERVLNEETGEKIMEDSLVLKYDTITTLKYTYHNDQTPRMAKALLEALKQKGIPENRLKKKAYKDKKIEAIRFDYPDRPRYFTVRIF